MEPLDLNPVPVIAKDIGDASILASAAALRRQVPSRSVILVFKNVNIRLRARALGLAPEDYRNDQVIDDTDLLPNSIGTLTASVWDTCTDLSSWQVGGQAFYEFPHPEAAKLTLNEFVPIAGDKTSFTGRVVRKEGRHVTLEGMTDFANPARALHGVSAKNDEQNFALNLLMDPEIDFVTLLEPAGV